MVVPASARRARLREEPAAHGTGSKLPAAPAELIDVLRLPPAEVAPCEGSF